MLVLALLMLPLLLAPYLVSMSESTRDTLFVLDWFIWAVFGVELALKTYLSSDRPRYLREHWFDVLIVALPFLRPLRIARSARVLRAARGLRLLSFASRLVHSARVVLRPEGLKYALLAGALLFVASASLALLFERESGGNIRTFSDALWWGAVTITTVGYGDRFPVTTEGRAISVFLMLLGISLFSLITANVAALFVRPAQEQDKASLEDVLKRIDDLERLSETLRPADGKSPAEETGAPEVEETRQAE